MFPCDIEILKRLFKKSLQKGLSIYFEASASYLLRRRKLQRQVPEHTKIESVSAGDSTIH